MDFLDLNAQKQTHFTNYKRIICQMNDSHYQPDDYSLGMNCGQAAGQTIFHFHCHIIPRYNGDTPNPRGGIRHCIPGKGDYDQT